MIFRSLYDILTVDCTGLDSVPSAKPLTVKRIREKPNVDIDKT